MPGAYDDQLDHSTLTPAPLPGGDRRGEWKWKTTPPGPVGFLLENTFMLGGSLQLPQFLLRSNGGADVNLLTGRFNHVQPSLREFACQAI